MKELERMKFTNVLSLFKRDNWISDLCDWLTHETSQIDRECMVKRLTVETSNNNENSYISN